MERYSVDEFADQIAMDDLQAQKAINKIKTQTGGPCKYSASQDSNRFIDIFISYGHYMIILICGIYINIIYYKVNIWCSGIRYSGRFDCGNDSMEEGKRNVILPQSPMFWDPSSDRSYQFSEWLFFSVRYSEIKKYTKIRRIYSINNVLIKC